MKCRSLLFIASFLVLSVSGSAQIFQLQKIYTYAGTGALGFGGDGNSAVSADFHGPVAVALDGLGNVYVADYYNERIRKIDNQGLITTVAGKGALGYMGDGSIATDAEIVPTSMAVSPSNDFYICDALNSVIRKVNVTTGFISTVAGNGSAGYSGDTGMATNAKLNHPYGLAFDAKGNFYIADAGNHVVRKVNNAGVITTFAGNGVQGYGGDGGPAVDAQLDSAFAVAVDGWGNVYINDFSNNVIRKVDTFGIITTHVGTWGIYGYSGDHNLASAAKLNHPKGLTVDNNNNLYIADAGNNVIRKVDITDTITTVVGNGTAGFGGDLDYSIGANLNNPYSVAVDWWGSIYVADANNQRIRKSHNQNVSVGNIPVNTISATPNPCHSSVSVAGLKRADKVCILDMAGRQVSREWLINNAGAQSLDIHDLAAGSYLLQVKNAVGVTNIQLQKAE